jgi:hypothetical protein
MNTTTISEPRRSSRPHMFESYGRLGGVLAAATQIPDWDENTLTSAEISWNGRIHMALTGRTQGADLAARLGLPQTEHETSPTTYPLRIDTPTLTHRVTWEGTYAGRPIKILTYWDAPATDTTIGTTLEPIPATQDPVTPTSRPAPRPARRIQDESRERSVRFEARFASTCPLCEEQIEAGADVAWSDGDVVHDTCASEAGVEVFER